MKNLAVKDVLTIIFTPWQVARLCELAPLRALRCPRACADEHVHEGVSYITKTKRAGEGPVWCAQQLFKEDPIGSVVSGRESHLGL